MHQSLQAAAYPATGAFHMRAAWPVQKCRCDHAARAQTGAWCPRGVAFGLRCGIPCRMNGRPCAGGTGRTGRAGRWAAQAAGIFACQGLPNRQMLRGSDGPMPTSHRLDYEYPQPSTRALTVAAPEALCPPPAVSVPHVVGIHQSAREQLVLRQRLATYSTTVRRIGPPSLFSYNLWNHYPTALLSTSTRSPHTSFPAQLSVLGGCHL